MSKQTQKKILVPVDGSDRALNTVRYIAKNEPFFKHRIVLLHVFSAVPESYWDLETEPHSGRMVKQVRAWQVSQKRIIQNYMEQAHQLLLKAGFPRELIETRIQNRKKGIARDIIAEARKGYEAVVTRRRGMTGLRGIVLGSVATKLVEKLDFLPLILVGKKPSGRRVLIAFDGSEDATKAVDFVGAILGGFDYEAMLVNAIRGNGKKLSQGPQMFASSDFTRAANKAITPELYLATKKLISYGFNTKNISTKIIQGVRSRAKAITDEASNNDCGTIAIGRKGRSRVRSFILGRVTNKVIYMARNRTVWVIR